MLWIYLSFGALFGVCIGGFMRSGKELDLLDRGYKHGHAQGVTDERCRGRKSIYESFDEGYKRGYAKGFADAEDAIPQIVLEADAT